jgi:hypothetical protein
MKAVTCIRQQIVCMLMGSREVDGRHTVIEARVGREPTAFRQVNAGEPVLAKVDVAVLAQHVSGVERLSLGSSLSTATFIIATLLSP